MLTAFHRCPIVISDFEFTRLPDAVRVLCSGAGRLSWPVSKLSGGSVILEKMAPLKESETAAPQPASLHEELLSQLRELIVEGRLAPGSRVPERELSLQLSVSRTPLREALKVLAAEGLIELLPNRGARVRRLTETDVRNLFDVVAGLEFVAGRSACEKITDEGIAAIEQLHYQMYAHYVRRELSEYFRLNQIIHTALVKAADNSLLLSHYDSLNALIRRVRFSANLAHRDRLSEAMREHEAIVDALRRRAGEELGLLMFAHLRNKCEAACECLREAGDVLVHDQGGELAGPVGVSNGPDNDGVCPVSGVEATELKATAG
jgi:DNA-binding GntR family transcriptional regulator